MESNGLLARKTATKDVEKEGEAQGVHTSSEGADDELAS